MVLFQVVCGVVSGLWANRFWELVDQKAIYYSFLSCFASYAISRSVSDSILNTRESGCSRWPLGVGCFVSSLQIRVLLYQNEKIRLIMLVAVTTRRVWT